MEEPDRMKMNLKECKYDEWNLKMQCMNRQERNESATGEVAFSLFSCSLNYRYHFFFSYGNKVNKLEIPP